MIVSDLVAPLSAEGVGDETIPELVRLGEQLTRAREGAGFSLEALAKRLRVEPRLLQALEQGDHRKLPEGVFIVALARRIAGSLNVNLEDAITNVRQSRLMEHKPPGRSSASGELTQEIAGQPPQTNQQPTRQKPRHLERRSPNPWVWPLVALLTACGAASGWLLLMQPTHRDPSSPRELGPVSPGPATPKPSTAQPARSKPSPAVSAQAPASPPTAAIAPSVPADNTLRLQTAEPSWLEVRDTSGKTVFEGTFSGVKNFPLGGGLEVISGRPHAVRASIGAGQAAPLGGVDDIRWKRFSPQTPTPAAPAGSSP